MCGNWPYILFFISESQIVIHAVIDLIYQLVDMIISNRINKFV